MTPGGNKQAQEVGILKDGCPGLFFLVFFPIIVDLQCSVNPGLFHLFRAAPVAYGGSQDRGEIGAAAASLHHSHSNTGSEPHLQPAPQLTATQDP